MKKDDNDAEQTADLGMSPLRESAIQLHELYSELRQAGFTRSEAMQIICASFSGNSDSS